MSNGVLSPTPAKERTPRGWAWTRMDALATEKTERAGDDHTHPVLSVTKHQGIVRAEEYFKKVVHGRDTSNYKVVRQGEFAYATIHLDEGSIGLLTDESAGIVSPMYTVFEITDHVDPKYLLSVLKSPDSLNVYRHLSEGTVNRRASINFSSFGKLHLLHPPLPEQRKIAAILSSVDAAIEATQAVIDQLQVVKKAMMAELLTRGLPGRHTRFKQTEIGEVPEGWDVVHAADVCSVITKGATPAEQTRDAGEVPFLKVYNIDSRGFIDFNYQPTFIPRNIHEGILGRSRVFAGDVLMNIVGPPLGKVAVVPQDFPESNINQAIAVFRPNQVEPFFLATCLKAPFLFAWAVTRAKRTSTQLNLTLEICRDYPMPLPPPQERAEINNILAAIEARTSAETDKLEALNSTKSALSSALLTGEIRVKPDEATP